MSELLAYCELYRIEGIEERETICTMVRAMDRAFIEHMREKTKKDSPPRRLTRK